MVFTLKSRHIPPLRIAGFVAVGMMIFSCSVGDERYPPGGKRIINVTKNDQAEGNADYRRVVGQRFRILRPTILVCDALKVTRALAPDFVSPRSWLDRFVMVRDIEHIQIHHQAGDTGYFTDYVHCVLEKDSGETGHWFSMTASPDRLPKDLIVTPVSDAFQAIFAPAAFPGTDDAILGSFENISAQEPLDAPLLETVQGEERAAPERLIALLAQSPAQGIQEASLYIEQYRFHEVAQAIVLIIDKLPADAPGVHHLRRTAVNILGEIGDPSAVDILVQMLQNDDPPVRTAAAQALAKIGSWQALPVLEQAFASMQKPVAEPPKSPGGAIVDIYNFRQQRWEIRHSVLAAMVSIVIPLGPPPTFEAERKILKAIRVPVPSATDLLAAAALCYHKSRQPMLEGEQIAWLRNSVEAMDRFIRNEPENIKTPALKRVLYYIDSVHGVRLK